MVDNCVSADYNMCIYTIMSKRTEISQCYCINLRRANGVVTKYYDQMFKPLGLTVSQFSLLVNLRQLEPTGVSRLAEKLGLERTTLTRSLKPLFEAGLVEDAAPPDSRERRMSLTATGRAKIKSGMKCWIQAQNGIEDHLGPKKLALLQNLLRELESLGDTLVK